MLALDAALWAVWVGSIGTVLAFGATSWAIWAAHRLRLAEHRTEMYYEALNVTYDLTKWHEVINQTDDVTIQRRSRFLVTLKIHNGSRWRIIGVKICVLMPPYETVCGDAGDWRFVGTSGWLHPDSSRTVFERHRARTRCSR
jgi:hypothetical protein